MVSIESTLLFLMTKEVQEHVQAMTLEKKLGIKQALQGAKI